MILMAEGAQTSQVMVAAILGVSASDGVDVVDLQGEALEGLLQLPENLLMGFCQPGAVSLVGLSQAGLQAGVS